MGTDDARWTLLAIYATTGDPYAAWPLRLAGPTLQSATRLVRNSECWKGDAVGWLVSLLAEGRSPAQRECAACILGALGTADARAVTALELALTDEDLRVRGAAAGSLATIRGE